jgi:hypothetical protein
MLLNTNRYECGGPLENIIDQSSFQVIVDDSNIVVHDMEITIIMGCTIFTLLMHYQIKGTYLLTFIHVLEYIKNNPCD